MGSKVSDDPTTCPTPATWNRVAIRYRGVVKGMTPSEVVGVLGEPNEITPLYEPEIFDPKQIGRTYVYAKTKFVPPQEDRDVWLRVDFDNQDRVWGVRQKGLGQDSWVIPK